MRASDGVAILPGVISSTVSPEGAVGEEHSRWTLPRDLEQKENGN